MAKLTVAFRNFADAPKRVDTYRFSRQKLVFRRSKVDSSR